MQNIQSLVQQINQGSGFQIAADDPSLQFQASGQRLVFSELLPEVNVDETHSFRIDGMRMNSRIANSSTRYSEPATKDSHEMQSALVELREADIGMTLNQPQIESLQALLGRNSRDAISRLSLAEYQQCRTCPTPSNAKGKAACGAGLHWFLRKSRS